MTVAERIASLGLVIPTPPAPAADYLPWIIHGGLLYVSGQLSIASDGDITGALGRELGLEEGRFAAHACGLNLIAQIKAATDSNLERVARVLKVGGFVRVAPGFRELPAVLDGCSQPRDRVWG